MSDRVFFDTNILIYILVSDDPRGKLAERLFLSGGVVSVQVLDEFVDVARRKFRMPWAEVKEALHVVRIFCPEPVSITMDTHDAALRIAEKYGMRIYDALIVASALETNSTILFTEDLQDGQVIDARVTIQNPFR